MPNADAPRKADTDPRPITLSFIGSAGIPNRYGGFEAFLEHCGPEFAQCVDKVIVTCDRRLYCDNNSDFQGVKRIFIPVPANGVFSILHDAVAFFSVFNLSSHIVILGVSGGVWFPLFRILCSFTGKKLIVNVDGIEWRRDKHGPTAKLILKLFDSVARHMAHAVIVDSLALKPSTANIRHYSCIGYPGDHVVRLPNIRQTRGTALTICRIEMENNIEMLISGALDSRLDKYVIVGNWSGSSYGQKLRDAYFHNPRLQLLEPIYDSLLLARLREDCEFYLHGHRVGGTNPSLVEMLFYDCKIFCFDVVFNRLTAAGTAQYFSNSRDLTELINSLTGIPLDSGSERAIQRQRFTRQLIVQQYLHVALNS